ncbi:hypothetical protein KY306_00075 [Candidatus Woesearchaeota archaeon]|nr:hypothetical protein [Candidatus Woesearchaeota archaeon]
MGLVGDIKEFEKAKRTADNLNKSIISFLDSIYQRYQEQIDEKAIAFWEESYGPVGSSRDFFGMGAASFSFHSRPKSTVELHYQNETWSRIENCPQPGPEYLDNIKEELEAFAKDLGINVLKVQDPFYHVIEIQNGVAGRSKEID